MYKSFFLFQEEDEVTEGKRIYFGEIPSMNEAWLRDMLFKNPGILPINEIDSTFQDMIPLCKELQTPAGRVDAVYINAHGRITIVECKLWKNPQARREVVAQTLDYVSALSSWSYSDFQRQVSAALNKKGNIPYEVVRAKFGTSIREDEFIDSVSRCLREARFLVLIAGDGIRDGMQSLTELVNRNATKAFSFGIVEVAFYDLGKRRIAIQPRVLLETETITREITLFKNKDGHQITAEEETQDKNDAKVAGKRMHLKDWWAPVLNMSFDDPDQERPYWVGTNNAVVKTPFPGILIKAYATVSGTDTGVFVSGPESENSAFLRFIRREKTAILKELPRGTSILDRNVQSPVFTYTDKLEGDLARQQWIIETLNAFVNALRPRLKKWYSEFSKKAA